MNVTRQDKMILYTYTVKIDRGAAPNPFFDICTLAICKPKIRLAAKRGDWVVGFGSMNVNGVDYSGRIVYVMKATESMSFSDYDSYCRKKLKGKISGSWVDENQNLGNQNFGCG